MRRDLEEMRALALSILGKGGAGRGSGRYKGPEVGGGLSCWTRCKEDRVERRSERGKWARGPCGPCKGLAFSQGDMGATTRIWLKRYMV